MDRLTEKIKNIELVGIFAVLAVIYTDICNSYTQLIYTAKIKITGILVKKKSFYKITENFDWYYKIENHNKGSKEKRI